RLPTDRRNESECPRHLASASLLPFLIGEEAGVPSQYRGVKNLKGKRSLSGLKLLSSCLREDKTALFFVRFTQSVFPALHVRSKPRRSQGKKFDRERYRLKRHQPR